MLAACRASASSAGAKGRGICWAPALSQTHQAAERLSWASIADPCFFHPSSPFTPTIVNQPLVEKRCSFDAEDDDAPSASNRRRLSEDPLYKHPAADARFKTGGAAAVVKLDLVRDVTPGGNGGGGRDAVVRQPTPRPTDAQAAWAASFTENASRLSDERLSTRPNILSPINRRPDVLSPMPIVEADPPSPTLQWRSSTAARASNKSNCAPVASRCTGVGAYSVQGAERPSPRRRSGSCPENLDVPQRH